jgi:competence protein ComFC
MRNNEPVSAEVSLDQNLADTILQLIFPSRCLFCGIVLKTDTVKPLCSFCADPKLPLGWVCQRCGKISGLERNSVCCDLSEAALQGLFALCYYNQRWRKLLHDLKYRGKRKVARPLGRWLAGEIKNCGDLKPFIITSVPLHCNRQAERGYNQSALIARQTAKYLDVKYADLLIRTRETESQTRLKRHQRLENVKGAFVCQAEELLNARVLLIDDIFSTGATMTEAAGVITKKGALVYGAVVAYNPFRGDI